jgi:hypothetical protein
MGLIDLNHLLDGFVLADNPLPEPGFQLLCFSSGLRRI